MVGFPELDDTLSTTLSPLCRWSASISISVCVRGQIHPLKPLHHRPPACLSMACILYVSPVTRAARLCLETTTWRSPSPSPPSAIAPMKSMRPATASAPLARSTPDRRFLMCWLSCRFIENMSMGGWNSFARVLSSRIRRLLAGSCSRWRLMYAHSAFTTRPRLHGTPPEQLPPWARRKPRRASE